MKERRGWKLRKGDIVERERERARKKKKDTIANCLDGHRNITCGDVHGLSTLCVL